MQPRITVITLGVQDLERSLRFYRDGLGLPTTWTADKGVIFFKTRGTVLALYPYDKLAEDVSPAFEHQPRPKFSGIALAHNVETVEQVDAVLQQAQRAGAVIEKPGQPTFWGGYSGYFSDPDGHLWEVAQGAAAFNDDGSLIVPDPT